MTKKNPLNRQPIHYACIKGDIKKVNELMKEKGFKLNIKDIDGFTPIMFACHHGHFNIFNKLLKVKGVNINMKTYNGKTCLMLAAQKGHTKIVNKLLSLGAKINFKENKRTKRSCRTRTAYNMARMCGHNNIVKKLSKKKMVKKQKLSLKNSNNKPKVAGIHDGKSSHPWLDGLVNLGSTAIYKTNFEAFSMMKEKIIPGEDSTYFYAPYDFWEKRMRFLPRDTTKVFPRILNISDINKVDLGNLKTLLSSVPIGTKIVSLISESNTQIIGENADYYGHMMCIVWHKGVDKSNSKIVLHNTDDITLSLVTFLNKNFESYTTIDVVTKKGFTFDRCVEIVNDEDVNADSCVFMSHLAAELELRNIVPPDNKITVDMQKGYATFIMKNYVNTESQKLIMLVDEAAQQIYSERLKLSVVEAKKQIENRMKLAAAKNTNTNDRFRHVTNNVRFSILGNSYQISKAGFYSIGGSLDSDHVLNLMKNDNKHFFTGDISVDEAAIKILVDSINIVTHWVTPGHLR
jgi:hypothetical protein